MRAHLLIFCFITTLGAYAQSGANTPTKKLRSRSFTKDTLASKLSTLIDSVKKVQQSEAELKKEKEIQDNAKGILQLQSEKEKREQRSALIRIVIGLFLFVIMVFALVRRRRSKK